MLNIKFFPESFSLTVYERAKVVSESTITSNNNLYKKLYLWYSENLNDWKYDFNSYVPSVLLYSDNFKVNLILDSKIVVINYFDLKGEWKQVNKALLDEDVNALKAALFERSQFGHP